MAVDQISKPPLPAITEGKKMSVSQGENGAKRRSPARALLVQHQAACLCLSVGTSSQWTVIASDRTVSSGLAGTSDFAGRDRSWVWVYFWGSDEACWVKRSRPLCLCVSAPEGHGGSCRVQGMTVVRSYVTRRFSKSVHGIVNAQWGNSYIVEGRGTFTVCIG